MQLKLFMDLKPILNTPQQRHLSLKSQRHPLRLLDSPRTLKMDPDLRTLPLYTLTLELTTLKRRAMTG